VAFVNFQVGDEYSLLKLYAASWVDLEESAERGVSSDRRRQQGTLGRPGLEEIGSADTLRGTFGVGYHAFSNHTAKLCANGAGGTIKKVPVFP